MSHSYIPKKGYAICCVDQVLVMLGEHGYAAGDDGSCYSAYAAAILGKRQFGDSALIVLTLKAQSLPTLLPLEIRKIRHHTQPATASSLDTLR